MRLRTSFVHKAAYSLVLGLVAATVTACGGSKRSAPGPSGLSTRVFVTQSVAEPTARPGIIVVNGFNDTLPSAAEIPAGASPGLMAITSDRKTVLVLDAATNNVSIINASKESSLGSVAMPGPPGSPITSMVALASGAAFVPDPSAPVVGSPPGAVVAINLATGNIFGTVSVPNAQTIVTNAQESQLLVFSNDSDSVTVLSPNLVDSSNQVTAVVAGFDRPVYAVFSSDGSTAYVVNCGLECGGVQASVQLLNMTTTPPSLGAKVSVNGATTALLQGSTLYVAGNGSPSGPLCASIANAAATAAQHCGTLDLIDIGTLQDSYFNNPAVEIAIPDGYHNRIDMSENGQLFIGSQGCTNVGDVNNPVGEVRGCLGIFNTSTAAVVIPPDNGDVTGLQNFSTRFAEYVVEGNRLRVYNTQLDSLLLNDFVTTGTIIYPGQFVDIKAVDFF